MGEKIAYIDKNFAKSIGITEGFQTINEVIFENILLNTKVGDRDILETDETKLQLVVYVVLRNTKDELLIYKRSIQSNEIRLHDLWSVGFGGHIKADEEPFEAAVRELQEETSLDIRPVFKGLLYSEETPVSRVHLGLVYEGYLRPNETPYFNEEVAEFTWLDLKDLQRIKSIEFENWSKILIDHLLERSGDL